MRAEGTGSTLPTIINGAEVDSSASPTAPKDNKRTISKIQPTLVRT